MIIKNIQVLRAFAALSVLFLHTVYAVNDYNFFQLTKNFSSWGDFGVDIFFIISGFIMIYIKRSQKNALYFLKKRISRILPLYWFFNILYLFLFILFPTSFRTLQISSDNFLVLSNFSCRRFFLTKNLAVQCCEAGAGLLVRAGAGKSRLTVFDPVSSPGNLFPSLQLLGIKVKMKIVCLFI